MVARFRLDPVVLALAAACAALAAVVVHQVGSESHAKPGEAVGRHGTGTVDVAALQNWAMPPAADFAATLARPLFTQGRRPPATASAVAVSGAGVDALSLTLTATIVSPAIRIALVERKGDDTRSLAEGEEIDGWKLVEIAREHVLFAVGERTQRIALKDLPAEAIPDLPGASPPIPAASPNGSAAASGAVEATRRMIDGREVEILPEVASAADDGDLQTSAHAEKPD